MSSLQCIPYLLQTSFKIPAPAHPPAVEADAAKQRLADAKGLRRSGRVRNEIVMHDYEAGSEAAEGWLQTIDSLLLQIRYNLFRCMQQGMSKLQARYS